MILITRFALVFLMLFLFLRTVHAEIALKHEFYDPGNSTTSYFDDPEELDKFALEQLGKLSAREVNGFTFTKSAFITNQFFVNGKKYFVYGAMFMPMTTQGQTCTSSRTSQYQCEEGGALYNSCHLAFFNMQFKLAGLVELHINSRHKSYCNAMPAIGIGNKEKDELLTTIQYFDTTTPVAKSWKHVGADWRRMTVRTHIREENGKIIAEQLDDCLGNPNEYDTIASARKALKKCGAH